jgi:hypothetical protein
MQEGKDLEGYDPGNKAAVSKQIPSSSFKVKHFPFELVTLKSAWKCERN